jgi:hypothetical protein
MAAIGAERVFAERAALLAVLAVRRVRQTSAQLACVAQALPLTAQASPSCCLPSRAIRSYKWPSLALTGLKMG